MTQSAARPRPERRKAQGLRTLWRPRIVSAASWVSVQYADGIEIGRRQYEVERKPNADREHEQAQQKAEPFAAHFLPRARAELCAGHTTDHEEEGQQRINEVVGSCVHDRGR